EPHVRARVEGVDRHLAVGRAGDLDAAVFETRAGTGDPPGRILPHVLRLGQEPEVAAVAESVPHPHAGGELVVAAAGEAVVQLREELERLRAEDLVVALPQGADDLDSRVHCRAFQSRGVSEMQEIRMIWVTQCGSWGLPRRISCISDARRGQWNWAVSVEPTSARVSLFGLRAVETRSK